MGRVLSSLPGNRPTSRASSSQYQSAVRSAENGEENQLSRTTKGISIIVVTERDLREQIRDLCKIFGWRMYFTWTSIHSPRGFPDLVLAHPDKRRLIFAELKSDKGHLTLAQEEWIELLRDCAQEVYLWRPGDIEQIAEILRQ